MSHQISKTIVRLTILLFASFIFFTFLTGCQSEENHKRIGIIVPIEHKAMDEIVAGFTETLKNKSPQPLKFKVANAQGDLNLQRAILQQMKDEGYDIIVPIGTVTTQMAVSMIHTQPIVSLAAIYTVQDREKQKPCNITVVHDEISPQQIITFIHQVYPQLSQLTLVHSASDKIFPDLKVAVAAGKNVGIEIKTMMAPTLNELYSIANAIPQNTQAILVLKDNLIVSGIATLELTAEKRHIPLITSDQGSVQDGASFALGVHERDIGVEGAALAVEVLNGKAPCNLPLVDMKRLTVFINKSSLNKQNQSLDTIQAVAKKLNYNVEFID